MSSPDPREDETQPWKEDPNDDCHCYNCGAKINEENKRTNNAEACHNCTREDYDFDEPGPELSWNGDE